MPLLRQPIPDVITATATALVAIRTHLRTTAGITVPERIIQRIAVSVQRLRILHLWHDGVGLHKPPQRGVVVSGVVKVQANCSIFALPCEAPSGGRRAGAEARLAPGAVQQLAQFDAAAVDGDVGPTQMIAQQVVGLPAAAHRHARAASVVVLSDRTVIVALVMVAHVDRGRRPEGGLDPVAVSVVDERGRSRTADARQTVLGVVAVGGGALPSIALGERFNATTTGHAPLVGHLARLLP